MTATIRTVALCIVLVASLSTPASGEILTVLGFVLDGVFLAADVASENKPEIKSVEFVTSPGTWYVGETKTIDVKVKANFGAILPATLDKWGFLIPPDVGTLTLTVYFQNNPLDRIVRKYTIGEDNDPNTKTITQHDGEFDFSFKVEARDVATNQVMTVHAKVDGVKVVVLVRWPGSDEGSTQLNITVSYPFETQPGTGKIGWLSPSEGTVDHWDPLHQSDNFNQTLRIKNLSSAAGKVESCQIGDVTQQDVVFDSNGLHDLATGKCVHDASHHLDSQEFQSSWELEGIGLILSNGSYWTTPNQSGPSNGLDNTCDGTLGTTSYNPPDLVNPAPNRQDIHATLQLYMDRFGEVIAPAPGWEVQVIDPPGSGNITSFGPSGGDGTLTIDAELLGGVIDLKTNPPVLDSTSWFAQTLRRINSAVLDASVQPQLNTIYVAEKRLMISGWARDQAFVPLWVDVSVINLENGQETYLGSPNADGATFQFDPIGMTSVGAAGAEVKVRPRERFNITYTQAERTFSVDPGVSEVTVDAAFHEIPPWQGDVSFRGEFRVLHSRTPYDASPLPGLEVEVAGLSVVTDEDGYFEIIVPGPAMWREVTFPNADTLPAPGGGTAALPDRFNVLFGRGGPEANLGIVHVSPAFAGAVQTTPHPGSVLHAVPNPSRGGATISFSIDAPRRIDVFVYDVAGRLVRRLAAGEWMEHSPELFWDGKDDAGHKLSAGIYICTLQMNGEPTDTQKIVLLD